MPSNPNSSKLTATTHKKSRLTALLFLIATLCGIIGKNALSQNLTLPVYQIEIAQADLRNMVDNPAFRVSYPAVITYQNEEYDAKVKFRGASALNLPKHSWRIEFTEDHPGSFEEINLDAEYYDRSISRDHLAMQLGRQMGLTTPDSRFVSLIVNGDYYGVYLQVEPINGDFLDRHDLGENEIFASISHVGRGAPFLEDTHFRTMYELQVGTQECYDELGKFLTFLHYATTDEIDAEIEDWIDVDNVLKYFALQFVIGNVDGFGKNFHLVRGDDNRYLMIPWDCDGTLGNDWAGNWANEFDRLFFDLLMQQAFFRRTLELQGSRDRFFELVTECKETHLQQTDALVASTFARIRNDAYLDTLKRASNEEFDEAFVNLREYITDRKEELRRVDDFLQIPMEPRTELSNHYLSNVDEDITFTITTFDSPAWVHILLLDSLGEFRSFQINDNGQGADRNANDGIFTRLFNLRNYPFPIYYNTWVYPNDNEGFPFPRCGLYLQNTYPFQIPAIQINSNPVRSGDVSIVRVDEVLESASFLIGLRNNREGAIDLSGCNLALNSSYRKTMLPRQLTVPPGDTVWVTNHLELMKGAFRNRLITGTLYFTPMADDTISLYNGENELICSEVITELRRVDDPDSRVVINEINYNSNNRFDTGDWLELTTVNSDQNIGGWKLSDSRSDNFYLIPNETTLGAGEFLIIAKDPELFNSVVETAGSVIGGFDFSFDNQTDDLRLLDATGAIVDWVNYADRGFWPEEPDGEGPTLELINPGLSNFGWQYWEASRDHGTPGRQNGVYTAVPALENNDIPLTAKLTEAFPNPFNGAVRIDVTGVRGTTYEVIIYDLSGRVTANLNGKTNIVGRLSLLWHPTNSLPNGIYYARIVDVAGSNLLTLLHLK